MRTVWSEVTSFACVFFTLTCAVLESVAVPQSSGNSNPEFRAILLGTVSRRVSIGGGPETIETRRLQLINGVPNLNETLKLVPADAHGIGSGFIVQLVTGSGGAASSADGKQIPSNPVSILGQTRTLSNGTVVRDCFDLSNGLHVHGEEFVRSNIFKFKCNNGTAQFIGCIATERANFSVIELGKTLHANGFWHKCEYFANDQTVRYTQETSCLIDGKHLHIGETFRRSAFKMRCESWGQSIAGCYYVDANGEQKELEVGGIADVGNLRHTCEKVPQVEGRVKYYIRAFGCVKNGVTHKENEEWTENRLRFKCSQNGGYEIQGCVLDGGQVLAVGSDLVLNHTVHRCYRIGITTYYHEYACGFPGSPSCTITDQPAADSTVVGSRLPPGWRIIDAQGQPITVVPPSAAIRSPVVVDDQADAKTNDDVALNSPTLLQGNGQPIDGLIAVGEVISEKRNGG